MQPVKQFYTYVYRDPRKNGEPFYVGKGYATRAYDHVGGKSHNREMRFRLAKMCREKVVPIIEVFNAINESAAFVLEVELIALFGRKDLKKGPLLNRTNGGEGVSGRIQSQDELEQRSIRWRGSNNPNHGGLSENHRKKVAIGASGKRPLSFSIACSKAQVIRHQQHPRRISLPHPRPKGCQWWNNGLKNMLSVNSPGEGWKLGQLKKSALTTSQLGAKWWNNETESSISFDAPGEDWKLGRLRLGTRQYSPRPGGVGKKWWNNGIKTVLSASSPGEDWKLGRRTTC